MTTTITTNNVPRPLLSGYDLTDTERQELDYIEDLNECSDQFFRYRGQIYDTHEFVRIVPPGKMENPFCHYIHDSESPLLQWDGIQTDSFFSAVVVRYLRDDIRDNYNGDADGYIVVGLALS